MNEVSPELLEQLRDIHAAAEPGWWPPAPGWWILAALLLALLMLLLIWLARRWAIRRRRGKLLAALDHMQSQYDPAAPAGDYLAQLNSLFRVVAIRAFPGTASARLQGAAWVDFLRSLLPEGPASGSLSVLQDGPYRPTAEFDAAGLDAMAREWVKRYG
ncbi:MAG TPA: DUF4381 domain-containing protein [Xanthomonadales bacterium]|nr:DUF4381 domain-containing protein [Xanthomonadales bacterium]